MPLLRLFEKRDLEALYATALATGASGEDASALHRDAKLIGHVYAAPYAILSPETAFVAEDDEGVAGYIVGVIDTRAFDDLLERDWWPALRRQYADPSGMPPSSWNADQKRSFLIHHPTRTPDAIVETFPAHIHMNLLPRLQGRGVGWDLLNLWLSKARELGADGVHLGASAENFRAIAFWQRCGFRRLIVRGETSIWFGLRISEMDPGSPAPPTVHR
jgi:ribosomal protein S18 acetylase RimI-like enzyme